MEDIYNFLLANGSSPEIIQRLMDEIEKNRKGNIAKQSPTTGVPANPYSYKYGGGNAYRGL